MSTGSRIVVAFLVLLASPAAAQVTRRASVGSGGAEGDLGSHGPSISDDGRYVVFHSDATNFVALDGNGHTDVFVRDLLGGTTELVSVSSFGVHGDFGSRFASISGDGRYVAFQSWATNLIPIDEFPDFDVYVRDLVAGTTEKVSVDSNEVQAHDGPSWVPVISADGRYVAFYSEATDLVTNDTNGEWDVFVRDRVAGTTDRVSVSSGGIQGNAASMLPAISADGRFVAFSSDASNLVANDTNGTRDLFLRDLVAQTTERVNLASDGSQANGGISYEPALSTDGRFVAFASSATNLVAGDTNLRHDVFVRDRLTGTTERASVDTGEVQGNGNSRGASLSGDGRFVTLTSDANNLVSGDVNGERDVFLRDRLLGTTQRVSLDSIGVQGDDASEDSAISGDGRWMAFRSAATDLVAGDTNDEHDVFVRDREATSFASLCDPGGGGILPCPCANPPSGAGRGCDNSAATGGARLTASGTANLAADTLVFTTSGQQPTALSIVLQGRAFLPVGTVYGQGIRCVDQTLKRLYTKGAVGGSITAPDFGAGDPPVSARSAAKGDPIQPGQPRTYLVYYRDTIVLGGCPATSNFNATQTGQVSWAP